MKTWKKIMAGAMALSMVFMTACSGGEAEEDAGDTAAGGDGAKGRYLEEEYQMPDGIEDAYDLTKLSDGTLRMITNEGIFESEDQGKSWEISLLYPDLYQDVMTGDSYIQNAASDKEGNLFFTVTEMEVYKTHYIYVSADGMESEVEVDLPANESEEEYLESMSDQDLVEFFFDASIGEGEIADEVIGEVVENEEGVDEEHSDASVELTDEEREAYREMYRDIFKESLYKFKFSEDGSLLGCSYSGAVYRVDPKSGEITSTYGSNEEYESINDFVEIGEKLYVSTSAGISVYDIVSGSLESTDAILKDYFTSDQGAAEGSAAVFDSAFSDILLLADEDGESLYFCDDTGLYRYTPGSSELERVINGDLTSMSNQQIYAIGMILTEKDEYLALNSDSSTGTIRLMNYVFSKEASAVPSKEIKIYALKDSQNLRQAISTFQSQNPDYYVNLEIGITGDDAVTASDAMRVLNTNIMAGNGPDILVLDGMPINSYIEKDLLLDISDLVEEAKGESGFFENILNTNSTDSGLHAVPTRFMVPVLLGEEEMLKEVNDLKTLADALETLNEQRGETAVWNAYAAEQLTERLLAGSGAALTKKDGTIDEEMLSSFLEQLKRIYDVGQSASDGEDDTIHIQGMEMEQMSIQNHMMSIISGGLKANISNVISIPDLNALYAVNKEKGWSYQMLDGLSTGNFIPMDTVGINAKSENVEESREFVKALLSEEMQKITVSGGLPVNTDAYDALYTYALENREEMSMGFGMSAIDEETGEVTEISMDIKVLEEDDYKLFREQIENLEQASDLGQVVEDAVLDGVISYVNGDHSLEEAVESIIQTVNLYLAE